MCTEFGFWIKDEKLRTWFLEDVLLEFLRVHSLALDLNLINTRISIYGNSIQNRLGNRFSMHISNVEIPRLCEHGFCFRFVMLFAAVLNLLCIVFPFRLPPSLRILLRKNAHCSRCAILLWCRSIRCIWCAEWKLKLQHSTTYNTQQINTEYKHRRVPVNVHLPLLMWNNYFNSFWMISIHKAQMFVLFIPRNHGMECVCVWMNEYVETQTKKICMI